MDTDTKTKINEIFQSVQGEGPFVGYKQLFIRFCGCNLNCNYCDTEFLTGKIYTPQNLYQIVNDNYNLKELHSISLTGGEPLLSYEFLQEFLPLVKNKTKIYLETNATLYKELEEIKNLIDIISADIKLPSCSGKNYFDLHEKFFQACNGKTIFAKIVFDENISEQEIQICTTLASKYNFELVLQPKMINYKMSVSSKFCTNIFDKFIKIYPNTRLIPQVHKFLDVR